MKSHKWQGEKLVITLTDGPAIGEYRPSNIFPSDGILVLGIITVDGVERMLKTRIADFPGLAQEISTLKAKLQAEYKNKPQHCERCTKAISGDQITWSKGKYMGVVCSAPYCSDCARLLRIFAGGIGVAGEPLENGFDDRTPAHKEDF